MNKFWGFLKTIPEAIKLILVAAVVFLVTGFFSGRATKTKLEDYIDKYKIFEQRTEQTIRMLDSVQRDVAEKDKLIASHMSDADVLREANARLLRSLPNPRVADSLRAYVDSVKKTAQDSVELARSVIPALESIVQEQDSTITVYRLQVGNLTEEVISVRSANLLLVSQNKSLRGALDSTRTNLVNLPDAPANPDKFFFGLIDKPTRTQVLVVGFVGGVITTIVVRNNIP